MKKIFREVKNKKGEVYSVMLTLTDDGEVVLEKSGCDCVFMSWFVFGGQWKNKKTLCRHMLQVLAEEELMLPKEYQTERNLKLIETLKKNNGGKKNGNI